MRSCRSLSRQGIQKVVAGGGFDLLTQAALLQQRHEDAAVIRRMAQAQLAVLQNGIVGILGAGIRADPVGNAAGVDEIILAADMVNPALVRMAGDKQPHLLARRPIGPALFKGRKGFKPAPAFQQCAAVLLILIVIVLEIAAHAVKPLQPALRQSTQIVDLRLGQLPQLLRQFGMDCCIFGRGYHGCYIDENGKQKEHMQPSEFRWHAPDGSKVLAVCMSFWYNNTQRFSAGPEKALALARLQKERFAGIAQTPYLLCMNGCDHLEAQSDLLPVLRAVQERLGPDEKIYQTTLEAYAAKVRKALQGAALPERNGELITGLDVHVLKDTASSRIYLKTKNAELQNRLERRLEPLYTLLESSGMDGCYPKSTLDYLWRMLIRNHAHDSICGCSKDAVHRHMEDRFAAIEESVQALETRGLALLNAHISRDGFADGDYLITVVNTLQRPRTGCVDVRLDIHASDTPRGVTIFDSDGKPVPYVRLAHRQVNRRVTSPLNLPGFVKTEQFDLRLPVKSVPACGYIAYRVRVDEPSQGQTLPEALNEARTARSSRLAGCPVTLTLRLNAGEPFLRADWQIENHARDHRLRMLVRTGLDADVSTALSPFDLVQHRRSELDVRLCNESRHNSGMI